MEQWRQFHCDLNNVTAWIQEANEKLEGIKDVKDTEKQKEVHRVSLKAKTLKEVCLTVIMIMSVRITLFYG